MEAGAKKIEAKMTAINKQKRIESETWTQASKDQPCTLEIPGVCNYNKETTVPCHTPSEIKGMAYKSDDITIVDGCSACHKAIDGDWERETGGQYNAEDKLYFILRALQRTLRNRFLRGVLIIGNATND